MKSFKFISLMSYSLLMVFLIFMSCDFSTKEKEHPTEEIQTLKDLGEIREAETEPDSLTDFGLPFEAQQVNDSTYLFQGDILIDVSHQVVPLEPGDPMPPRTATARTKGLWPDNTVYYEIDPKISHIALPDIKAGLDWFHKNTNIKWVERPHSNGYVYFTNGNGCSSYIGKIGYRQNITLGTTRCGVGSTIHEMMHAIGFWHEQSRSDRDKHVKIWWENIQTGMAHNFRTYLEQRSDGQELSEALDFGSIMMYPAGAFTANGKPTITKLNGSTYTVQRNAPSKLDKEGINKLYPAAEPEKPVEPVYENGKYYTLDGLYLLRQYDRWYYFYKPSTGYGYWTEVRKREGTWYFAR